MYPYFRQYPDKPHLTSTCTRLHQSTNSDMIGIYRLCLCPHFSQDIKCTVHCSWLTTCSDKRIEYNSVWLHILLHATDCCEDLFHGTIHHIMRKITWRKNMKYAVQLYLWSQYSISTKCLSNLPSFSTAINQGAICINIWFHSSIDHFMKNLQVQETSVRAWQSNRDWENVIEYQEEVLSKKYGWNWQCKGIQLSLNFKGKFLRGPKPFINELVMSSVFCMWHLCPQPYNICTRGIPT